MAEGAVPRRIRLLVSVALGAVAAVHSYQFARLDPVPRDFSVVWSAGRALLRGDALHDAVPGLLYPLPSVIAALPWTMLHGPELACAVFMFVGAAAFAWALQAHGMGSLVGFLAAGTIYAAEVVQWSPLFAGAYAVAPLAMFLAVKPHTGLAIFAARPSWWAAGSALVCLAAASLLDPAWFDHWRTSLAVGGAHVGTDARGFLYAAPVGLPGGFLVLLALTRWRRPEARLLVALACAPQSLLLYETVPLALVPRGWKESATFVALSYVVLAAIILGRPWADLPTMALAGGKLYTLWLYLPLTLMVLRRPNEGASSSSSASMPSCASGWGSRK